MRRPILVLAVLGAIALAAGGIPAFSADGGSVVATVNVEPPPAPCITVSTSTVDFGTLPLSDPAAASTPTSTANPYFSVGSCSTGPVMVSLGVTPAVTPGGATWAIADRVLANTCVLGPNVFGPGFAAGGLGQGRLFPSSRTVVTSIPAGNSFNMFLTLQMPCRGSAGAGESVRMRFDLLALVV